MIASAYERQKVYQKEVVVPSTVRVRDTTLEDEVVRLRSAGVTFREIGRKMGFSSQRAQQLEARAWGDGPIPRATIPYEEAAEILGVGVDFVKHSPELERRKERHLFGVTPDSLQRLKEAMDAACCEVCGKKKAHDRYRYKTCSEECLSKLRGRRNIERYIVRRQYPPQSERNEAIRAVCAAVLNKGDWVLRLEASSIAGLLPEALTYLGVMHKFVSTKPDPQLKRLGTPFNLFSTNEMKAIRELKEARPELFDQWRSRDASRRLRERVPRTDGPAPEVQPEARDVSPPGSQGLYGVHGSAQVG